MDAATDPTGEAAPSPGDASICLYCGHIMIYTDQLTFRNPNDAEMHEIAGDERILKIQRARGLVKKQIERMAFEDPNHEGNSPSYHTGKPCIEKGCERPAGTWWSPHWCFEHNVERIKRISKQFDDLLNRG
jgi:hypothetical protein